MIAEFILSHIPDFFWGLGAFVLFVLILLKAGIKPVAAAMAAREAKIAHELKESEEAYGKARTLKDQLDAQLRNAEAKIGEMMAEARRDAEAHKAQVIEQGRVELDGMRGRALREIDAARQAAIIGLRAEVAEIATGVAEKILRQRLDASTHEQLVAVATDAYEAGIGASAAGKRG